MNVYQYILDSVVRCPTNSRIQCVHECPWIHLGQCSTVPCRVRQFENTIYPCMFMDILWTVQYCALQSQAVREYNISMNVHGYPLDSTVPCLAESGSSRIQYVHECSWIYLGQCGTVPCRVRQFKNTMYP